MAVMNTIYLNDTTKRVELLFRRIPGIAYNPPAGQSILDVSSDVFCSVGAFQQLDGSFAFPPNPDVEPEPASLSEISEAMTVIQADFTTRMTELQAKLDALLG